MPLPTPREGEEMETFIARFMGDPAMQTEYPDEQQRSAVAFVQWGKQFLTYKNVDPNPTSLRIKPIAIKGGWVESGKKLVGYASVSNVQDLERDVILPGAWAKTLAERVKGGHVPLMTKHVATGGLAGDTIGWMTADSHEDEVGLWAEFEMLLTDEASKCYDISKASAERRSPMGLSVEFFPIEYEPNAFGGYNIKEAQLIQVTLTPTPCNELSGVYGVKARRVCKREKRRLEVAVAKAKLSGCLFSQGR